MTARWLGLACAAALFLSACGDVKADWGFEEAVDWDVGEGSNHDDTYDPCAGTDAGLCDPLTNAGCDADAGYACSYYQGALGPFACLSDSTEVMGAACDADDGPWCGPGLACDPPDGGPGLCVSYCCGDEDCAADVACAPFDYPDIAVSFGFCAVDTADAGI
jgi:hypothetical protein